jgi:hypothetical protein
VGVPPDAWHGWTASLWVRSGIYAHRYWHQVAWGRNEGEMLNQLRQRRITGIVQIEGPDHMLLMDPLVLYRFSDGELAARVTSREFGKAPGTHLPDCMKRSGSCQGTGIQKSSADN